MKVKRKSDGKIISVPDGHWALDHPEYTAIKAKPKAKPKKGLGKPKG